ncbi:cysteine hydrolase [Bacillus timonensis]|nr:cysteine hydrolase [Bacillus timonensis]
MMEGFTSNTVLLIIDVQKGFDDFSWGERNNPQAEENIEKILQQWRNTNRPVIHIQHLSEDPASPLYKYKASSEIKEELKPIKQEPLFTKSVNSAFIGTNLETYLREKEYDHLVVVGLTTDHCVSTTVRMAANLGFHVTIVSDATATFAKMGLDGVNISPVILHNVHLTSLQGEFARVLDTKRVLECE